MNKRIFSLIVLSSMAFMFVGGVANAAINIDSLRGYKYSGLTEGMVNSRIVTLTNWLFGIVLAVGIIMIIVAGLVWITSAGNQEKVTMARKMLIWGLIGIAVAIVSYSVITFLSGILNK